MSEWMKYVYMQFEQPSNVNGVTVKFEAIDPNFNYQDLGTTTTDIDGNFGLMYEPEVPGQYMIIATFEGTNSFYGTYTTTYVAVDPAPTPSAPIEPEPAALPDVPLITTEVAIIALVIAVAVVGIFWIFRKRQ
jgi:hypothetical protein